MYIIQIRDVSDFNYGAIQKSPMLGYFELWIAFTYLDCINVE